MSRSTPGIFFPDVGQYLGAHVNYLHDDWTAWLPLAEFAANNQASEATGVSPFLGNHGFDPPWQLDLTAAAANHNPERRAERTVRTMSEIHEHLKLEIIRAQLRYQDHANEHQLPAQDYQVDDCVWLDGRNWKTRRPASKPDNKRHGPLRISERISPYAYRLELHDSMHVHPVFHVSLLELASQDPYPGQRQVPPPPVEIDGEQEWFVDAVLDSQLNGRRRRLQYLIKWTGYDKPEWEDAGNVQELEAVDRFHEAYPYKPRPLPRND
jgi:hypothetical protein